MMNGFSHAVVHPRPLRTSVLAAALFARAKQRVCAVVRGKDEVVDKLTYPAVIGLEGSRKEAAKLTQAAMVSLKPLGKKAGSRLREIADYMLKRDY